MTVSFRQKITALLLVIAMFAGTAPVAVAAANMASKMPSTVSQSGAMSCDQQMPMPDRHIPCNDSQNCMGMLGCAAPVTPPQLVSAPVEFHVAEASWDMDRDPNSIATPPAYRPPII
jgi:hypothetical protein